MFMMIFIMMMIIMMIKVTNMIYGYLTYLIERKKLLAAC